VTEPEETAPELTEAGVLEPDTTGVSTMTVPVESVPAGPRVNVVGAVPVPAWVMVVKGPVNVTEPEEIEPVSVEPGAAGVWTITVPVESVPAGPRVTVVSMLPVPA
jgi:hypothetical protein